MQRPRPQRVTPRQPAKAKTSRATAKASGQRSSPHRTGWRRATPAAAGAAADWKVGARSRSWQFFVKGTQQRLEFVYGVAITAGGRVRGDVEGGSDLCEGAAFPQMQVRNGTLLRRQ